MKPRLWEASLGSLTGAIVGAIGGLFAVGLAAAILSRDLAVLLSTPILSMCSWLISGVTGWLFGGQIGPRLGDHFQNRNAEITGGVMGGLIPVVLIALWGWYMVTPH
jgi:hypothetical protein